MHWWESGHASRTHYRYIGLRVLKQGPEILTKNSRTCIEIRKIIPVVHLLVSFSVRTLTQIMTTGRERPRIDARFIGLPYAISYTRE